MSDGSTHIWSNWSGRETSTPHSIIRPAAEADIAEAITSSRGEIRAVGATHSHSAVAASNGVVIDLSDWVGVTSVAGTTATARSGTRIHQLGAPLRAAGVALYNQGDIDRQSLSGACSTGTHGTGIDNQNLSASVEGFRLAIADGSIIEANSTTNTDVFRAGQLSLGALGVMTELTVRVRPAYRLHERIWLQDLDEVLDSIDDLARATRHFEFFWYPGQQRAICKSLDETTDAVSDLPDRPYERIGWSDRIISSDRTELHTEMEYSVPAEVGPVCFNAIRTLIASSFPELEWPLEYRNVAQDDVWMSPANGRPTVTISVHQAHGLADEPLFRACEEIFVNAGGRPHWGKVHFLNSSVLRPAHRDWDAWWAVRDRLDPQGRFVTSHLEQLRG
jgi:FAD/FMN-containing dehydrogenase